MTAEQTAIFEAYENAGEEHRKMVDNVLIAGMQLCDVATTLELLFPIVDEEIDE